MKFPWNRAIFWNLLTKFLQTCDPTKQTTLMCIYIYIYIVHYIFDIRHAFLLIISLCKPTTPFFCSSCILKCIKHSHPQHHGFSNPTGSCKIWHLIRRGGCWGAGRELLKRWNNPMGSMRWNKKVLDLHFCKKMILHLTYEAGFSASQSNLKPQVINLSWVEQCSNPSYIPLNWLLNKDSPI